MESRPSTLLQDPHVCARCAGQGPTCCRLEPGQENLCFPLSKAEWERICDFRGERGAFVQTPNVEAFRTNMRRLFPKEKDLVDKLFPVHGVHLRLATRDDGSCVFLTSGGCSLPREARPYYCRLFPFWFISGGMTYFTSSHCLAVREQHRLPRLLESLGLSEKTVRELHGRLRLAWGLPPAEGLPVLETAISRQKK